MMRAPLLSDSNGDDGDNASGHGPGHGGHGGHGHYRYGRLRADRAAGGTASGAASASRYAVSSAVSSCEQDSGSSGSSCGSGRYSAAAALGKINYADAYEGPGRSWRRGAARTPNEEFLPESVQNRQPGWRMFQHRGHNRAAKDEEDDRKAAGCGTLIEQTTDWLTIVLPDMASSALAACRECLPGHTDADQADGQNCCVVQLVLVSAAAFLALLADVFAASFGMLLVPSRRAARNLTVA
eukprot:1706138-Pleurochrysis_carterae.AAC.1